MPIHTSVEMTIKMSQDESRTRLLLGRKNDVVTGEYGRQSEGTVVIPASGSFDVPMTQMTNGNLIYVEAQATLIAKFGGASTGVRIEPAPGKVGRLLIDPTSFSSVVFENESAEDDLEVYYFVAGTYEPPIDIGA